MFGKIIGISLAAALVLFSMFAGGNGASLVDYSTLKQDEKTVISLIDEIAKTQSRYENVRGFVANSIGIPATSDGGYTGSEIALSNGFTSLLKLKDGSKFNYNVMDAHDKETYLDFEGIKFYTAPVSQTVTLDPIGTMGTRTSYKMFIDLNGYTGNPVIKANLEQTICEKVKEKFGDTRVTCGGTEETITSFSAIAEISLTPTEIGADAPDGDGLITVSVVDKEKYN